MVKSPFPHRFLVLPFIALLLMSSSAPSAPVITSRPFGSVDSQEVNLYTLANDHGFQVSITNYGGTITSILAADRSGQVADVALGYQRLEDYLAGSPYFGCITGRYANRIRQGKFTLNGREYKLAINNETNHLHGGKVGFDKKVWQPTTRCDAGGAHLELRYTSPDGEEGYPGTLEVQVTYTLTDQNELRIAYSAGTDAPTVLNLTNHCYFNLAGEGSGKTILDHQIQIQADEFTPVDATLIPTGIASLDGTPLDFRKMTAIGERIAQDHPQLQFGRGYDHNYVVQKGRSEAPNWVATVLEPVSGRTLKVFTTEPGMQFYCGNFLDGTKTGKSGQPYHHRTGLCLETQVFPDSPNQHNKVPGYTSALLQPGETYRHVTIYRFGTDRE